MAAGKSQKAKQPAVVPSLAPNPRTVTPAAPTQPALSAVNGKKPKKKKGKGKQTQHSTFRDGELHGDVSNLEDPDRQLPPINGLSPQLESLHITTTGYTTLSQTSAGVTTQVHGEILATPGDIHWRNIEVQANGRTGARTVPLNPHPPLPKTNGASGPPLADDEYWSSFPPHIKNFAQTMYNIAQQMVQSDTYLKNGTATATATMAAKGVPGYPPGAYPPLPFDPSIFSDPAFTLSVEQAAAAALGAVSPSPGQPPRGPLPQTNVVLLNEFEGGEHEFAEEDYYSEDEVDGNIEDEDLEDDGFDLEPRPARPPTGPAPTNPDAVAHVVLSYGETAGGRPAHKTGVSTKTSSTVGDGATKQTKRKDSAKIPAEAPVAPPVPNAAQAGQRRPAGSAPEFGPEKGGVRPTGAVDLTKRAPLTAANAMPATRKENVSSNPPPSSRAQGKQPMAYPPTSAAAATTNSATAATLPANGQQPARTARAASKAPITANPYPHNHSHHHPSPPSSNASAPHKPRPPAATASTKPPQNNSKIWSTSTIEERERIKEFWLGLGEEERRNLVKIEKETVLKKMKEQQKHSCSCAVCGRKRHAIEEELEVLYDAYYEELEQYANYQQRYVNSGGTIPPPPGPGPFPGSVELDKNGAVVGHPHAKPTYHPPRSNRTSALTNGRKPPKPESEFDDDEGDDDDYEEEDEYDDDEEEEEEEEEEEGAEEEEEDVKPRDRRNPGSRGRRPVNGNKANGRDGLFNLGSSLTVTGPNNILTVADDLLKNDGQKFLEMMEQLAERRMQREEEAAADVEDNSDIDEDDEGDDEDEDEEDEEDEDGEEIMTEEQKMEEGKRMFSIFAARMFEQRVLQSYREKVAQERQQQLLRELEDEDKLTKEREAKKQTQNQKKKDKKKLQKQAKEEERAAKAAEKAAEEAALKARQQAHEEELRKKKEEEKARREAARKAAEEEKQRKDEERRKRLAEEREREAERERKRKEKEEKLRQERREREEKERKVREEREAKVAAEKAAREAAKKEQQEKEEREKKLAKEREEKVEKERVAQQQRATAKSIRQPTSPRASGSAQRSQSTNGSKKILSKPAATPTITSTPNRATPQRPSISTSQPATPVAPSVPNPFPPPVVPLYPPAPGMVPPSATLPPYVPPPPFGVFGPGPSISQGPPPSLAPSTLPRAFGSPSPFDPPFSRGLPQPAPIGPPPKAVPNPVASPTLIHAGPSRKASLPEPGPGPVARPISIAPIAPPAPIAPIARPTTGETSGSGSGSPVRRSPSPKGVLGSSALAADDDEVVPPPGRRTVPSAVGQSWGATTSPRSGADPRPPWGPPAPLPGFGSPRPPPMSGSLWGNMSPEPPWQSTAGFFPNAFVNPVNSSPPPHAGN